MIYTLFLFVVILLLFPDTAAEGSRNGLVLWASILVPSLFPFSVLTSLIRKFMKGTSGKYMLICSSILSGYPMGAKISGELYQDGQVSKKMALFLCGFTNNPSPMFIIFFIGEKTLHLGNEKYIFFLFVILSSLLGSTLYSLLCPSKQLETCEKKNKRKKKDLSLTEQLDDEISSSALLLLKIGGYIMLFSILTSLIQKMEFIPYAVKLFFCSILEITTANSMINTSPFSHNIKIILSLAITSFGGLCAAAQTNSVIQKTGLKLKSYVFIKAACMLVSILFGILFTTIAI